MGYSQVVRQPFLVRSFRGSSPLIPKISTEDLLFRTACMVVSVTTFILSNKYLEGAYSRKTGHPEDEWDPTIGSIMLPEAGAPRKAGD